MYKEPLRSDSLRRQRHIVDCFARLLEATPYPGLTVRQVCTAAGVSRTVFYRYFERNGCAPWRAASWPAG